MIADEAVTSRALKDLSITRDKLADRSVITRHLENESVTNDKLAYRTITNSRIAESTIEGSKLKNNIALPGTPTIGTRPTALSNNDQIPDTRWVKDLIASMVITNNNLGDRIVNGRTLFTSSTKKRVLVVNRANSDPEWGQIEKEMMANDSVDTNQIANNAVINTKIADNSLETRHFTSNSIKEEFLKESSVSMNKIVKSESANMILGVTEMNSHPRYTKVTRDMLDANAVGGARVIEDKSVPLSKLVPSEQSHRVIGVGLKGSNPEWMQVTTNMIANHAVGGQQLFTSPSNNRVLAVVNSSDDPSWLQVQRDMIAERAVDRLNIANGAIWQEHLQEGIIEDRHIADRTISSDKLAARSINGEKLFTSPMMNRVLAVIDAPYTDPQWVQITNEMLADGCIDRSKLFQSKHPNRVLGVTEAGVPPEYLMITNDFIMDDTIKSSKLTRNLILKGTPELTVSPDEGADNHQIADTSWVRSVFKSLIKNFEAVYGTVTNEMLDKRAVTGDKLFTSHYDGPRVIGVTKANEDPEYLLVEEDMIADGAVTTNKIQRDVHLLGSPVIDVRPAGSSSDNNGGGDLIPDCQWVLDRIAEAGGTLPGGSSSGTTGVALTDGSVITKYIQDRSVIGSKLFTSATKNRVLAVLDPNTDPVYTQITSDMIGDRQVIGSKLFTSEEHNRVLAVGIKGSDPEYMQINTSMIEDKAVNGDKIADLSINTNHVINGAITFDKLANEPLVDTTRIQDNSVTTEKIVDKSIETEKIEDKAITSEKLDDNLVLRGTPTVKSVTPETRSLKNITISSELPTADDGEDGDLWITYI